MTWITQIGPHRASEPALTLFEKPGAQAQWLAAPTLLGSPQGWDKVH